MKKRGWVYLSFCWIVLLCGILCCTASADSAEIDNLEDVYTISVNEELYLPKPDWSGGEESNAFIGFSSYNPLQIVSQNEEGYIITCAESGVFPLEAWIYVDGSPILKWVTIVVKDLNGTISSPGLNDEIQFYDTINNKWTYFREPQTTELSAPAGSSFDCTYRIVSYDGYYQYYQDCPEWTVTQISGPEYSYTTDFDRFYGDFIIFFQLGYEATEDAEYEITVSWHGTTVSHRLIIQPLPLETWELLYNNSEIPDDFVLTLEAGRYYNHTFECGVTFGFDVKYYSYFKNKITGDPELEIRKLSGQDIEYSITGYEDWLGNYCFGINFDRVPSNPGESEYQVVCTWGSETISHDMTIQVVESDPNPKSFSFVEEDITVKAREDYTLHVTGENFILYDLWLIEDNGFLGDSDFIMDKQKNTIECCTYQPGFYVLYLRGWDGYSGEYIEDSVVIRVTDEEGTLPELREIQLSPNWPRSAVPGESYGTILWWWYVIYPCEAHMEVEHNGEISVYDGDAATVTFEEEGDYILRCYLTDAFGREAYAEAVCTVAASSPLLAKSLEIQRVSENGPNDYEVFLKLNYSGGVRIPSYHYKIFAKDENGNWYMTWEEDNSMVGPCFWIGEDGDHYFRAEITDGETTVSVSSEVIHLGEGTGQYVALFLPDDLTCIEEQAFEDDTWVHNVQAGCNLKRIESRAFAGCRYLVRCYIPSSIEYIADDAFEGASELIIISESEDSVAARYAEEKGYSFEIGSGIN